ncbi:unnamed protein product [Orchesella dallaii]|uniref:F-box domain-containing protein n=1 Tax=Orchesella dallaii TaxID=48710 RepID=A0ABP1S8U3_9HEXA
MSNSIPLLPELWNRVFGYLTTPEDFQAVINTCQQWHNLLYSKKPVGLFGQVLPILNQMRSSEGNLGFDLNTLLTMREVHSEWRNQIDNHLDCNPKCHSRLSTAADMEAFMTAAAPLSIQRGNPFLGRSLELSIDIRNQDGSVEAIQRLFETYGRAVTTADLGYTFGFISPQTLASHLALLPSIEVLKLVGIFDVNDDETHLPVLYYPLSKLKRLDISRSYYARITAETGRVLFSPLLRSCSCSQTLTYLCAGGYRLKVPGINEIIPNLKQLHVWHPVSELGDHQVLSELRMKLEDICITNWIVPSVSFLSSLNNFRTTLTILNLNLQVDDAIDSTQLGEFPSLKTVQLRVRSASFNNIPSERQIILFFIPVLCPRLEVFWITFNRALRVLDLQLASAMVSETFKSLKDIRFLKELEEDGDEN